MPSLCPHWIVWLRVRDAVDRLVTDVYAGKLHPKIAAGLALLLQLQQRALDSTDVEGRLSKLERLISKREQSAKSNGGKYRPKFGAGLLPIGTPLVGRDSEKESGSRITTTAEPLAAASAENAHTHNAESRAPEAESKLDFNKEEGQESGDCRGGPRIQDAAARAAERDSEPRVMNVEEQVPSEPRAQEPTTNTAHLCEKEPVPRLANGTEQRPPESKEAGPASSRAVSVREQLEQAIKEAWERFPPPFK
jgi:hypothetical protein